MKKTIIRSVVCLVVVILSVVAVSRVRVGMADPLFDNIASGDSIDAKKSDDVFNILLVGVDNSDKLADAIMIVNVNKNTQQIKLLSIPRDTRVSSEKGYRKINSCYGEGIDALISEVKALTGVYINYYAVIRPGALAAIVDALGGVEVEVEQDMKYSDPVQGLYIDLKKGKQVLGGDEAEQYCRYRQYVMGDIERTRAQQNFFSALFEQKLNIKYVTKLGEIFQNLQEKVSTNVTFNDIMSNIDLMQMLSSQTERFETPGRYNDMQKEGVSYYIIENGDLDELRDICSRHFKIN